MKQNKKMIEVLLDIYEYELLQLFQIRQDDINGSKVDEEKEITRKLNITKNDIITWCNTGKLPKENV